MQIDHKTEVADEWAKFGTSRACQRLGLRFERSGPNAMVCCPFHKEKNPSCSVTIGQERTLRFHCFACDQTWDIFAVVAELDGLDVVSDFRRVLVRCAELVGRWDVVEQVEGQMRDKHVAEPIAKQPEPEPEPEKDYPPIEEVWDLLSQCVMVEDEPSVARWIRFRGIDPHDVAIRDLALAIPDSCERLPSWCRFRGTSWGDLAHRLIMPIYGPSGSIVSVRAGRVERGDSPKRLPPSGYRASGLVMLDSMGREAFKVGGWPEWNPNPPKFLIVEGEPDFLTVAVQTPINQGPPSRAVIGIYSGSWCDEIAAAIPDGAKVVVATDDDKAGNKYAMKIKESLGSRCKMFRRRVLHG